jgi:hypothetical protein
MIDMTPHPNKNVLMQNKSESNAVSDKLKQAATVAPFVMEKSNYLMAAQEIDRLHGCIQEIHTYIYAVPYQITCAQVLTHIQSILQAHES